MAQMGCPILGDAKYSLPAQAGNEMSFDVKKGRNYAIAITAEGSNMSEKIEAWFENEIGLESRITKLGHIQRGGNPSVFDRLIASEFVINALDQLSKMSNNHHTIVYKNGSFDFIDIDTVSSGTYTIKPELLKMGQALCR